MISYSFWDYAIYQDIHSDEARPEILYDFLGINKKFFQISWQKLVTGVGTKHNQRTQTEFWELGTTLAAYWTEKCSVEFIAITWYNGQISKKRMWKTEDPLTVTLLDRGSGPINLHPKEPQDHVDTNYGDRQTYAHII